MKKLFLILTLHIFMIGCTNTNVLDKKNDLDNTEIQKEKITLNEPAYIDDNPITVSLYHKANIAKEYNFKKSNNKEILTYNVYFTNVEKLETTKVKKNWIKYYNQYENIDEYKIGFYIFFYVNEEKIEKMIFDPSSKLSMTPYLNVYLYDGYHQKDGAYYIHLEPKDMKDNTVFTSIKLYLAKQGSKISSPISITVFTYKDNNDFDENGYYRGNSKYSAIINLT